MWKTLTELKSLTSSNKNTLFIFYTSTRQAETYCSQPVCPLPNLWIGYFEKNWIDSDANRHDWSPRQIVMCETDFFISVQFGVSFVWFGFKNTVRFRYSSCLLLTQRAQKRLVNVFITFTIVFRIGLERPFIFSWNVFLTTSKRYINVYR